MMNRVYKLFLFSIATVVATVVLGVLVPQTAHAVIATLVQVVNTPTSPVPTLDNSKSAQFNVELACLPVDSGALPPCNAIAPDGSTPPFTIPAGQFLVITSFDAFTFATAGSQVTLTQLTGPSTLFQRETWHIAFGGTQQLQFPTGIVVGPGQLAIIGNSGDVDNVRIHGYLTAQ
jgi:hypothetical protein